MRTARAPHPRPRPAGEASHSTSAAILSLVASGTARTRVDLARALDVSPSTVTLKVGQLLTAGLLEEAGRDGPSGGRRARLLRVVPQTGSLLVASVGHHRVRIGTVDLQGRLLSTDEFAVDVRESAEAVMTRIAEAWTGVVGPIRQAPVLGAGLSLPGPVDLDAAATIESSHLPHWNGWHVSSWFRRQLGLSVVVDNDANLGALGEYAHRRALGQHGPLNTLLHVKAGTGLGGGLVLRGQVHRGSTWLGGDIAHVRVPGSGSRPCGCGNRGCLETVVAGRALVEEISRVRADVRTPLQLMELSRAGDAHAVTLLRAAGGVLGTTLATLVNFINPDLVTLGGSLSQSSAFTAQVRAKLYESCHPLATRDLRVEESAAGADAEILGVAQLALRRALVLSP